MAQLFIRVGLLHVPQIDSGAGEAVAQTLRSGLHGAIVQQESYAASDRRWLETTLVKWCDEDELDLLLTIGGTLPAPGPSNLEIVPEATLAIVERVVPGLAEVMRATLREEFPGVALHRGVAGIRGRTLLVNLPAGVAAAPFLETILEDLPYILAHLRGDPAAVTLAQIVSQTDEATENIIGNVTGGEAEGERPAPKPSHDEPKGKGLNADDFAAFLRRGKEK